MNKKNTILSIFTVLLLLLNLCIVASAETVVTQTIEKESEEMAVERAKSAMDEILNPDGDIIGVCYRGLWREYPENSIAGIEAAAETGIDFVYADVKTTSDGFLILFADDSAERMLGVSKNINEMTYDEIKEMYLLESSGGVSVSQSQYKVATLEEALVSAKENDYALMLGVETGIIPAVVELLVETDTLSTTVLYCEDSVKNINSALENCENTPFIMGAKKGNVVFAIYSYISNMKKADAVGVNLKTTNRYGINFYPGVLNWFSGELRAMAAPVISATCGAREDSVKWWNDLISRGYSVIMTNYPELFTEYLEDCDNARNRLDELYIKYTENWNLPEFATTTLNDYYKAYNDAVAESESVLSDNSSSLQDINDAATHLQSAVDEINLHYEDLETGVAGTTITLPRILLCIAAVVAVVAVQIYFYKKRER